MPRFSRKLSATGHYHVIIRGVNRQDILRDDQDRRKMIDTLFRFSTETGVQILVYCLMDNHIHLLLRAEDGAATFIKKLASSYVYYFNRKYGRIGHLFQDRYRSEAVDTEAYLLTVARYILQNPQKAGICRANAYEWSSWKAIETGAGRCDTQLLCDCAGDRPSLVAFCLAANDDRCLDVDASTALTDAEAMRRLQRICGAIDPSGVAALPYGQRNALLARAKRDGLSVRQLSRLTGVDRNAVQRAEE